MREQTIVDDFFQDSKWSAESQLIRLAVGLGARRVAAWSGEEKRLAQSLPKAPAAVVSAGTIDELVLQSLYLMNLIRRIMHADWCSVYDRAYRSPSIA